MNLRDALLAGPEHGTDRLSVDADRRLRRRLGLESARAPARRAWLVPALAACAVAAVALVLVVHQRATEPTDPADTGHTVATGFVDVSRSRWDGTVTSDRLEVAATSPAPARVTWRDAAITAAPATRLAARPDGHLVLERGAIQLARTSAGGAPLADLIVDVPQGRLVIAAYRSSITVDRESVAIFLDDGSGQFIDEDGHAHALHPGAPWIAPSAAPGATGSATGSSAPAPAPAPAAPAPTSRPRDRAVPPPIEAVPYEPSEPLGPPGVTPRQPLRPDAPCTFKSDCDPGATCRKNEFGASVCMGNGGESAPCWFDTDCLSHRCIQRRCAK